MRLYLSILLIILSTVLRAQQISSYLFGSGGGTEIQTNIQITYSIGETVVGLRGVGDPTSLYGLQGFQQVDAFFNPLPVEWLRFSARADGPDRNRLDWAIIDLGGLSHFMIERSLDGYTFAGRDRVEASHAPVAEQHYLWYDQDIQTGTVYYRIRQFDQDGSSSLSIVQVVVREEGLGPAEVQIFPNPTQDLIYLAWPDNQEPDKPEWRLYDVRGRLLQALGPGALASRQIDLSHYPPGTYFYELSDRIQTQRGRLIKR